MTDLVVYTTPTADEWDQLQQTAAMVAKTEFAPKSMRGSADAVMACLLTGRELGIGPMQALREVYIVNGRPSLAATLMVSRVRAAGHRFRTLENTDQQATVQITRRGEREPEPPVTFTCAEAQRAGLAGKDVWKAYPARMVWARAASAACRRDAPESLGGVVYTPEEIESIPDDGPMTEVTWDTPEPSAVSPPPQQTGNVSTREAADTTAPAAAPQAGGPSAPTAGELPAWLVENIDRYRITESQARTTLIRAGFGVLRPDDWQSRWGEIAEGDIPAARQALADKYATDGAHHTTGGDA